MRPDEVVPEYFRCIREKDAEGMARFFASDAVKIDWQGDTYVGTEALIEYFLSDVFQQPFVWRLPDGSEHRQAPGDAAATTTLTPLPPMVDGNRSLVEVSVERTDGIRYRAIDLFTLNGDGRVSQLLVYRGPYVEMASSTS